MPELSTDDLRIGTVSWYRSLEKCPQTGRWLYGYGFITPQDGSSDIYVERRAIEGNADRNPKKSQVVLDKGQRVRYLVSQENPTRATYAELDGGQPRIEKTEIPEQS